MSPGGAERPTIRDVAERAGVSTSLVSLVLQESDKVSDHRRRDVLEAVNELGYRPHRLARGLVKQRSWIVGVVASDLHNPFFIELIDGLLEACGESDYRLLLTTGRRDPDTELEAVESLLELPTDGIVLLSTRIPAPRLEELRATPMVATGRNDLGDTGIATVVDDDRAGAALAVDYLADLGHRRILHLSGGEAPGAQARTEGYRETMCRLGLGEHVRIVEGAFTEEGGFAAMRDALAVSPRPTAVFAANDLEAIGALDAIEEAGLQIPDDMSLVGYDNSWLAKLRHISLTSVDQPRVETGRLAFRALRELLEEEAAEPARFVLDPELVVRATTGPPPHTD